MNVKKLGVTVLVIGSLVGGAIGVSAQDTTPPTQPGQGQEQGGGFGFGGGRPGMGERRGGDGMMQDRMGGRRGGPAGEREYFLMQSVMDATGLNAIELAQAVRDGSTLEELITANGGTVEAVVADAVADATAAINEAVANGNLTQEQADTLIAELETVYTNALTGQLRENAVMRMVDISIVRLAAELTNLNAREIAQQMRDGASLATILEDNGVTVADFTAEAIERAEARINVQVANGRVTEEQAAEMLAQFTEELNNVLSMTPAL